MYTVSRCPCGHRACRDWHVDGVAAVQGVHFTEAQAVAVAALLNSDLVPEVSPPDHDLILTDVRWRHARRLDAPVPSPYKMLMSVVVRPWLRQSSTGDRSHEADG